MTGKFTFEAVLAEGVGPAKYINGRYTVTKYLVIERKELVADNLDFTTLELLRIFEEHVDIDVIEENMATWAFTIMPLDCCMNKPIGDISLRDTKKIGIVVHPCKMRLSSRVRWARARREVFRIKTDDLFTR